MPKCPTFKIPSRPYLSQTDIEPVLVYELAILKDIICWRSVFAPIGSIIERPILDILEIPLPIYIVFALKNAEILPVGNY